MKLFLNIIIIVALMVFYHHFCTANITTGKEFLLSIPDEERINYLRFVLGNTYSSQNISDLPRVRDLPFPAALGIEKPLLDKFQNINTPENFTTNLYVWVMKSYNMDEMNMRDLIFRQTVCLSDGSCINIGDIGSLCCPF